MSRRGANAGLLDLAAINADRLIGDFDRSASSIRGVPTAGLEPGTRARTMAALDFANSLASSGARTAGGQGREYRKRSGLATRADQGGLNGRPAGRTRWDRFWDDAEYGFWNPDGYTVAGAIMPAFTIPHDALAYSEKYRAEQRKVAERAGAKPDKRFKARPGLQPKDPLMKGAKGLSRGLTVLNAGMSYQSALDSGRGKLDAAAKAGVVTGYIGFDATAPSLHVGSL
ncbi:MAG: hypothetical protein Q7T55_19300, partial [Solirubrobacteraceae bacterium]|nr:hypothetical protein [Solirubrobacteraceae bacterium]